jgi:hypothetical protein
VEILQRRTTASVWSCSEFVARTSAVRLRAESYRAHATHCLELAQHPLDAGSKTILEKMAGTWIGLAQEVERFELVSANRAISVAGRPMPITRKLPRRVPQ